MGSFFRFINFWIFNEIIYVIFGMNRREWREREGGDRTPIGNIGDVGWLQVFIEVNKDDPRIVFPTNISPEVKYCEDNNSLSWGSKILLGIPPNSWEIPLNQYNHWGE